MLSRASFPETPYIVGHLRDKTIYLSLDLAMVWYQYNYHHNFTPLSCYSIHLLSIIKLQCPILQSTAGPHVVGISIEKASSVHLREKCGSLLSKLTSNPDPQGSKMSELTMILAANVMSRSQNCSVGTELSSGVCMVFIRPTGTWWSASPVITHPASQPGNQQDNHL